ncbi:MULTISPECIES: hypothetical protein [Bacillaceae]|uniref:Uncharacterized protein n=1 Tax=Domibacillus aminovorans TaxID=29332 RepID=A0A177KHH4_9BACI|nr:MULTISPECIES: hypothetical protein [Bacillaceae]OAH52819.1 hypothetical protein AWH48_13485 [Domibacillus aminovorans]
MNLFIREHEVIVTGVPYVQNESDNELQENLLLSSILEEVIEEELSEKPGKAEIEFQTLLK